MRIILFLVAMGISAPLFSQTNGISIKGKIVDAQDQPVILLKGQLKSQQSGASVPYASVWIKDSDYGVASNDLGQFELPIPQKFLDDSLFISSLGFVTYKEKIRNLTKKGFLDIRLKEAVYELAEITFTALKPEVILLTAIKRIPYQFGNNDPLELEYFYRSVTKENGRYAYLIESAFRLIAKPDRGNAMGSFKLDYRAVRRSNNFKTSPLSRPFITPNVIFTWKIPVNDTDRLEKLIAEKAWVYELDYSSQDNDLVYIVKANINPARYPGDGPIRGRDFIMNYVFYIREKDYAILRIDYGLGDYAKRLLPEHVPPHLRLEATEDGIIIFKAMQDISFLQNFQVAVGYKWYESKTGKLIAQGLEKNEAIIQDHVLLNQEKLPLVRGHNHSIPVLEYDPEFWSGYILKDQIPLDPDVIKGLEHHHVVIEDQFAGNSTEWWNPLQYFLRKNENGWSGKLKIPPGTYEFKFMVNGEWISDPGNKKLDGEAQNSILVVD